MCTCIYVNVDIYIYIYKYAYMFTYMYIHIRIYIYVIYICIQIACKVHTPTVALTFQALDKEPASIPNQQCDPGRMCTHTHMRTRRGNSVPCRPLLQQGVAPMLAPCSNARSAREPPSKQRETFEVGVSHKWSFAAF